MTATATTSAPANRKPAAVGDLAGTCKHTRLGWQVCRSYGENRR